MKGFENIELGLKKDLIGKEFIYKSKYGGTVKSVVETVYLTYTLSSDAERARLLKVLLSGKSDKVNLTPEDETPIDVEFMWVGMKYNTHIRSENGVEYTINKDELYFLT
jgi:hypothetical protein